MLGRVLADIQEHVTLKMLRIIMIIAATKTIIMLSVQVIHKYALCIEKAEYAKWKTNPY
jgi:hypothetical protein